MNDKNVYKYALVLARDVYVDLENFEALHNSKRTFRIFQWKSGLKIKKWIWGDVDGDMGHSEITDSSSWSPFLFYDGKKWRDISKSKKNWKHQHRNKIMLPAHRFFKDEEEFKSWLTDPLYNKLFIDML